MRDLTLEESYHISGGSTSDPVEVDLVSDPQTYAGELANDIYEAGYNLFTNIYEATGAPY